MGWASGWAAGGYARGCGDWYSHVQLLFSVDLIKCPAIGEVGFLRVLPAVRCGTTVRAIHHSRHAECHYYEAEDVDLYLGFSLVHSTLL